MVADYKDNGNSRAVQAVQLFGEFPLPGWAGSWGFVGITGEENGVHVLRQGEVDDESKTARKIGQSRVEAGRRVNVTVVLDAEVQVGEMQQAQSYLLVEQPGVPGRYAASESKGKIDSRAPIPVGDR